MKLAALELGDILFIRKGLHDIVHVGICVEAGGTFETTKMAHTMGKMPPFAFVTTNLAPKEILEPREISYKVMRVNNPQLRTDAFAIMQRWLPLCIPYDQGKFNAMCKLHHNRNLIADLDEYSLSQYDDNARAMVVQHSLEVQRKEFESNKAAIAIQAARRNLAPTYPNPSKHDGEIEDGIICTTPIILSLQIAAIMSQVSPVDYWLPDELVSAAPQEVNFAEIPEGLHLDAMSCPAATLLASLELDQQQFMKMGVLEIPSYSQFAEMQEKFKESVPSLIAEGNQQKQELRAKLTAAPRPATADQGGQRQVYRPN